jgi:TPR repeat protein
VRFRALNKNECGWLTVWPPFASCFNFAALLAELHLTRRGVADPNDNEAMQWFERCAESNHTVCLNSLAWFYQYGIVVEKVRSLAFDLKARQSTRSFCFHLLLIYSVFNQNIQKALELYEISIANGDIEANVKAGKIKMCKCAATCCSSPVVGPMIYFLLLSPFRRIL